MSSRTETGNAGRADESSSDLVGQSREGLSTEASEGKEAIRWIALILIALVVAPAAEAHSRYWNRVHPWVGTDWKQKALCVHSHEGAWTDRWAPFWGGMQMDISFQRAYGPWMLHHFGTADYWPINGQLYASYKAWRVRGWTPWPTTARMCGLL